MRLLTQDTPTTVQPDQILQLLQTAGSSHWGAAGLVILLLLESAPVVGLFLPGVFIMVALGSLSGTSYLSFFDCVLFSSIGALLGDSIGYWIGHFGNSKGLGRLATKKGRDSRARAERLVGRYGRLAVFLGRFVWFFHPAIPMIAGATGIRPGWFYLADLPAVVLWVLLYAGIGHWATGAARERTLEFFVVVGVVIAVVLALLLIRYLRQRRHPSQVEPGQSQTVADGQDPEHEQKG